MTDSCHIHDWNHVADAPRPIVPQVEVSDRTLEVATTDNRFVSADDKVTLLGHMARVGIESAGIGRASDRRDLSVLARAVADQRLPIEPSIGTELTVEDCEAVAEIAQQSGIAVEIAASVSASAVPVDTLAGDTLAGNTPDLDARLRAIDESAGFAHRHGLPFLLRIDDSSRAQPETLSQLATVAASAGARRLCIADSSGRSTPAGARALVDFLRKALDASGETVAVDWSGRRDRGLAVACALAAAAAGAVRLHATVLGLEAPPHSGAGHTAMGVLLLNLHALGWRQGDLATLGPYCRAVAARFGVVVPAHHPVLLAQDKKRQSPIEVST